MNIFLRRRHRLSRDYFTPGYHNGLQLANPTRLAPKQVTSIVELNCFARSGPNLRLLEKVTHGGMHHLFIIFNDNGRFTMNSRYPLGTQRHLIKFAFVKSSNVIGSLVLRDTCCVYKTRLFDQKRRHDTQSLSFIWRCRMSTHFFSLL